MIRRRWKMQKAAHGLIRRTRHHSDNVYPARHQSVAARIRTAVPVAGERIGCQRQSTLVQRAGGWLADRRQSASRPTHAADCGREEVLCRGVVANCLSVASRLLQRIEADKRIPRAPSAYPLSICCRLFWEVYFSGNLLLSTHSIRLRPGEERQLV